MKRKFIISLILNILFIILFMIVLYIKYWPERKHYGIVMFGDSLTAAGNWKKLLNNNDIKVSGNPGFTTSHYIQIIGKEVLIYKPDICYIQGGINDIMVGIPLNRTINNYARLIDTLKSHHIRPIIQSTLYTTDSVVNQKVDSLNNFLIFLSILNNIHYINLNNFLSNNGFLIKQYSKTDGIHLNYEGYERWAQQIKNFKY